MTEPAPSKSALASSTPPKTGASAVRLLILVGLLALAIGAWYYDYAYAGPGSESKYEEVLKMADTKNAKGVDDGGVVMSKDVSEVIGFPPTFVEEGKHHTTEWYCWWGKIPVLSTWKRYITVVYVGEPRRFSSHYKNEKPPEEALPGFVKAQSELTPAATSQPPGGPPNGPPPGPPVSTKSSGEDAPPVGDKPAEDKPAEDKPAEDKPAEDKPAEDKPAEDKPAADKPAADKPAADKPAADKPAEDKPAADKPAADKPAEDKPAVTEASEAKPE
jgi:LPXTG-motif cell wall-anchored protein